MEDERYSIPKPESNQPHPDWQANRSFIRSRLSESDIKPAVTCKPENYSRANPDCERHNTQCHKCSLKPTCTWTPLTYSHKVLIQAQGINKQSDGTYQILTHIDFVKYNHEKKMPYLMSISLHQSHESFRMELEQIIKEVLDGRR
jgi:hypothetical protein